MINGRSITWTRGAAASLPADANKWAVDPALMKGATEHAAHATATRLGKPKVVIMGSLHGTTTIGGTRQKIPHRPHCTFRMEPGGHIKVHVYVDVSKAISVDGLKVVGESVSIRDREPDSKLSIGDYWRTYNDSAPA
ncbi:hypothetical protein P168DRAFT_329734 [Aspergillus campestris IBT 28561]|uniref:Uncharacterized protein n=1 Tax=Aspergillus campestris (strain IBT 28561) TaxID=1392248 RepID=A0A2I1CW45_ASPC2|nr:uncharacterized protein P168DRAFT_329734 [Aspergillus campestris IBT 28561]PKY01828.1 hypothetical protein P168DRAFT_329734 [Aspergillus campestris IBT 28561]